MGFPAYVSVGLLISPGGSASSDYENNPAVLLLCQVLPDEGGKSLNKGYIRGIRCDNGAARVK